MGVMKGDTRSLDYGSCGLGAAVCPCGKSACTTSSPSWRKSDESFYANHGE